ncbi:MAG: hypothetical protein B7X53_05270 [Hyphomonas sp. 34-62-18]|nr:manganese efflux pump MntP family protein [Hyphomonas sp. 34-62-18]OZB17787.1 MAG: hypothetical protein B7X53_05270 [Hyphomonas sp. 34-62-18]
MTPFSMAATALALAPDAFAASVARGIAEPVHSWSRSLRVGLVFGLAEGGMTAAGWAAAFAFADLVQAVDHWLALGILTVLGLMMIRSGLNRDDDPATEPPPPKSLRQAILTALGTSIDAASVGVALSFAGANILLLAPLIGVTSGTFSTLGFRYGPSIGKHLGDWAEVAGGVLLIAIGVWIFYSHVFTG